MDTTKEEYPDHITEFAGKYKTAFYKINAVLSTSGEKTAAAEAPSGYER